ncbi:hypothetical protein HID58_050882 [Brassica napus]|uniref:Uncharacterized protein n=1 Tax=Brassica napus TaxID=3708 RepID=A0ABQ8A7F6_BRANA|nr:hypothetical protein HID58_050882 [Brassica napus]
MLAIEYVKSRYRCKYMYVLRNRIERLEFYLQHCETKSFVQELRWSSRDCERWEALTDIFPSVKKIGRYYAAESKLILDPETGLYSEEKTPSYVKDTVEDSFEKVIRGRDGWLAGQELGEQF